jgi:hypothetical protein
MRLNTKSTFLKGGAKFYKKLRKKLSAFVLEIWSKILFYDLTKI